MLSRHREEVTVFTQNLSMMLGAGVNLHTALSELLSSGHRNGGYHDGGHSKEFSEALQHITSSVRQGESLTHSLQQHPLFFDPLTLSLVGAAEQSGRLSAGLLELAEQRGEEDSLRKKLKSAIIYPCFLVAVCSISLFVIFAAVLPRLAPLLENAAELSFFASALLAMGSFAQDWALPIFMILLIAAAILYLLRGQLQLKQRVIQLMSHVPIARSLQAKYDAGYFLKTLGSLLQSGVRHPDALRLASATLSDQTRRQEVLAMSQAVTEGKQLGLEIANMEQIPILIRKTIQHAEHSNQFAATMIRSGDVLLQEFQDKLEQTTKLLEPTMVVFIGLIIGLVMLAVFTVIQSINSAML